MDFQEYPEEFYALSNVELISRAGVGSSTCVRVLLRFLSRARCYPNWI